MGLSKQFIEQNQDLVDKLKGIEENAVQLEYGPLNKNVYTYAFETLVSAFLNHQSDKTAPAIEFEVRGSILFATYKGEEFNVSEILQYANLNHVSLNTDDEKAYHQFITNGSSDQTPSLPDVDGIPTAEQYSECEKASSKPNALNHLNWAEKSAINIYTGGFYSTCNKLLRGSAEHMSNHDSTKIGETLAHIAFASSGLNKVSVEKPLQTFRVEEKFSEDYVNNRVEAVEKGGLITQEMAFISTSHAPIADNMHKEMIEEGLEGGVITGIVYTGVIGKYVSSISKKPDEMEYLIPPTQMQWVGYSKNPNGGHIFHAKPVSTLTSLSEQQLRGLSKQEAQQQPSVKYKELLSAIKSQPQSEIEQDVEMKRKL
jgi:hypothetical protein